jgi:hypothetical protein
MDTTTKLIQIKQDFVEGLSGISRFWGFPRGMSHLRRALSLPSALSLDELVSKPA